MPVLWRLLSPIFFILPVCGVWSVDAFGAYKIAFERFRPTGAGPNDPRSRRADRYVLTLYPIPGEVNEYVGIQPPFGPHHPQKRSLDMTYAQIMAQVWWQAYEKIAIEKGLFKEGDAFHKQLEENEHPFDGRSALIAIFESADFNKPLSTLRASYPVTTPDKQVLHIPLVQRIEKLPEASEELKKNLKNMHTNVRTTTDEYLEYMDLSLGFARAMVDTLMDFSIGARPEMLFNPNHPDIANHVELLRRFGQGQIHNPTSETFIRLMLAQGTLLKHAETQTSGKDAYALSVFLQDAARKLGINIDFMSNASFSIPFLDATIDKKTSWAHSYIGKRIGGPPAEIKGLTHVSTADGMDSMWMLFFKAQIEGFFDRIPLKLNGLVPDLFVAETTEDHVDKYYPDWGWHVMERLKCFDRALKQNVVVVHMNRSELAQLLARLFSRYVPWAKDAESFRKVEFDPTNELLSPEERQQRKTNMMKSDFDIFQKDTEWTYTGLQLPTLKEWLCQASYNNLP